MCFRSKLAELKYLLSCPAPGAGITAQGACAISSPQDGEDGSDAGEYHCSEHKHKAAVEECGAIALVPSQQGH